MNLVFLLQVTQCKCIGAVVLYIHLLLKFTCLLCIDSLSASLSESLFWTKYIDLLQHNQASYQKTPKFAYDNTEVKNRRAREGEENGKEVDGSMMSASWLLGWTSQRSSWLIMCLCVKLYFTMFKIQLLFVVLASTAAISTYTRTASWWNVSTLE